MASLDLRNPIQLLMSLFLSVQSSSRLSLSDLKKRKLPETFLSPRLLLLPFN